MTENTRKTQVMNDNSTKPQATYAAVRFYSDETRKVSVVPISHVQDFNAEKCSNEPYYIRRYDDSNDKFSLSPGEVLSVSNNKENLLSRSGRHKFKKIRRSDALEKLRLKSKDHGIHEKNKKIQTKLKKLAKLKSGKKQLNKFLKGRRQLVDSDKSDNVFTENENDESNEQDSESTEIASPGIIDDSPRRASKALKSLRPELQRNNNRIDPHDEQMPLENYENITNARSPPIDNHSPVRSPGNQHAQSPLPHNTVNNDDDERSETPLPRRRRSCIVYRPKRVLRELAEGRDDTDDDDIFNNRLSSDIREVNPENFELYQKKGDEIYVGCGKFIQLSFWEYLKQRSHGVFLRELLSIFWTKHTLVNRCIKESKTHVELQNRSPRKHLTPRKYKVLRCVYKDYLNERYGNSSKKRKILRYLNRDIGYKIRDLRNATYEKLL
ncbi:uncharacterized protein [Temnothorax nylanderi]|uniref:uncharacterized protein isoform X1 n=1 Tax=Temnothorax nylanderi TaxID=102681 RepID=UPI003A8A0515